MLERFFKTKAQPIEIVQHTTPKVESPSQFARNISRLVNLYQAVEGGDTRQELKDEIRVRANACANFGHTPPASYAEAIQLKQKVIK